VAGVVMALRCVKVIRGINIPFDVDFTSSKEDRSGDVVPIPAAPFAGKVFCASNLTQKKITAIAAA
jgi:hypothetical protein